MAVTPESLVRHELVGLAVRVTAADSEDTVGIEGTVVAETTNTLGIERDAADDSEGRSPSESRTESDDSGRVSHVPKEGTTFTFTLPRGADDAQRAGDEVTVEGRRLVERPARRTENTSDSIWR